jgi:hypothetical protein
MLRELGFTSTIPVKREREQASKSQQIKKELIVSNASLMKRAREVNQYDLKLYELGQLFEQSRTLLNPHFISSSYSDLCPCASREGPVLCGD